MDRTFLVFATLTIGCLIVVGTIFGAIFYAERSAAETLSSTLLFSITIRPSQDMSNVTFLIPLPADTSGSSSVIAAAGAREIAGLPADWNTTLLGTDGNTFLGISAQRVPGNVTPYHLTMTTTTRHTALATTSPEDRSVVIRPRTGSHDQTCPAGLEGAPLRCTAYEGHIYAEYTGVPSTQVDIRLELVGKNTWESLGSHTGAYRDVVSLSLHGPVQGWHAAEGILAAGIGEDFP